MTDLPKTLIEAVRYFADEELCRELMLQLKWPDEKPTCPHCGGDSLTRHKSRPLLQCNRRECKKQISMTVGTVFEKSKVPLSKWFVAVWCLVNCRNGMSSHELGRAIGVGQDTAWFMMHRARKGLEKSGGEKMDGEVEADETFVGGYTHVAPYHLHRYAVEQCFRHGVRQQSDRRRFWDAMRTLVKPAEKPKPEPKK